MNLKKVYDTSLPCFKKKIVQFVIPSLFIFMFIIPAKAEFYQWTDKNGDVHYTNTVPPKSANRVSSSKEVVESSESKSMRMEQEREAELQRIEKEYKEALKKQEREAKKKIERRIQ